MRSIFVRVEPTVRLVTGAAASVLPHSVAHQTGTTLQCESPELMAAAKQTSSGGVNMYTSHSKRVAPPTLK
jgi:hypothetical protein